MKSVSNKLPNYYLLADTFGLPYEIYSFVEDNLNDKINNNMDNVEGYILSWLCEF